MEHCVQVAVIFSFLILCIHGLCDQRPFGGKMMCCNGKDSDCFVKVKPDRKYGQTNQICYCDSHCKFTNDCCEDHEKVRRLCHKPVNCTVSQWNEWSECDAECGFGAMRRERQIIQYPERGGEKCPPLQQKRGCNSNRICQSRRRKDEKAFILPISYRRPSFGQWLYEKILPAKKHGSTIGDKDEFIMNTYCIHYKVVFSKTSCTGTWANRMKLDALVCMECQARVMSGGRCRGEGTVGWKSRWKAIGLPGCYGDWIRQNKIVPNCSCKTKNSNAFVFV